MNMQAYINGLSAGWQRERAETQMTFGKMIAALRAMKPDEVLEGLDNPHSYRGYYCDLAFERSPQKATAAYVLALCESAMGQVFVGYKGGDFVMGALTPVWVASYGSTGKKLLGIGADGVLVLGEDK